MSPPVEIPLHKAAIGERERDAVLDVLDSGDLKGGGEYDRKCSDYIETTFGGERALMTTSCTHALEMAALLLDIGPGDEVILPSYTFTSTATAFDLRGADLTFCEIDERTLNMDPGHLRELASPETAAIVPVHYAGVSCEMDRIMEIADAYDVPVVEDAAQGVNATFDGEYLGTIGDLGCYSFHETKNFAAGEGGTLVVNDERYVERAEILRQKGTNYAQFQRGEVDRYTWVDAGSSYVPSELQTALAYTQLCRRSELQKARQQVYEAYQRVLEPLADAGHLVLPEIPTDCGTNYHLYHIRVGSESERDTLIETLRSAGIGAASHYEPLHTAKKGREFGYEAGDLPTTERDARRLIRLPLYPDLTVDTCERIATEIASFFGATGLLSN